MQWKAHKPREVTEPYAATIHYSDQCKFSAATATEASNESSTTRDTVVSIYYLHMYFHFSGRCLSKYKFVIIIDCGAEPLSSMYVPKEQQPSLLL